MKKNNITSLNYKDFVSESGQILGNEQWRCLAYFAHREGGGLSFYCLFADNKGDTKILSHYRDYYDVGNLVSSDISQLFVYEREISELYGVRFEGHPWLKPVRFPFNRQNIHSRIENYPFYDTTNPALHLVNVGPVHAGVIEPGAFRFICNGEKILHLEIALGYQHRGVEELIKTTNNRLRQICLAESIAGDSAVAHAVAMARLMNPATEQSHYVIALEMERIAMHLADIGALCMDVAYQLGQVACEALRTLVINTMQRWCGNRFGKGLIRAHGCHYPLTAELCEDIRAVLGEVIRRFKSVSHNILSTPTLLARFEEICVTTHQQAFQVGAVGMAARQAGLVRDGRMINNAEFEPSIETSGDLMARLHLRIAEIEASYNIILTHLCPHVSEPPIYDFKLEPDSLLWGSVEGWRGEIVHVALTDSDGEIAEYKIYDPSFHNWIMLALSVRGAQISDFPVSNKSFNLSYCGNDL